MSDFRAERVAIPIERCRYLVCKGMRIYGEEYQTPIDEMARTNDFWCTKTQSTLGPDSGLVTLSRCESSRGCYQAL